MSVGGGDDFCCDAVCVARQRMWLTCGSWEETHLWLDWLISQLQPTPSGLDILTEQYSSVCVCACVYVCACVCVCV